MVCLVFGVNWCFWSAYFHRVNHFSWMSSLNFNQFRTKFYQNFGTIKWDSTCWLIDPRLNLCLPDWSHSCDPPLKEKNSLPLRNLAHPHALSLHCLKSIHQEKIGCVGHKILYVNQERTGHHFPMSWRFQTNL